MTKTFKIFDIHTHAYPDNIAARAVKNVTMNEDVSNYSDGTIKGLAEYEKAGGASGYLLLPVATSPQIVNKLNKWAAESVGKGACAFGCIHPDSENIAEDLDYIQSLGMTGIKLHPDYQGFFVDEERMYPIYQAIFERGMSIFFHAGEDLSYPPPNKGDVDRIAKVCDRFPDGKILAAHMGGYRQYDMAIEHLLGRENLWIDTSYAVERMASDQVFSMIRKHGHKRVLFGTDSPWSDFDSAKNALLNVGLSEDELADILYNNAINFLSIQ